MKLKTTAVLFGLMMGVAGTPAQAVVLINDLTPGLYNSGIGTVLDGTSFMFPPANSSGGDPDLDIPSGTPPDLSPASGALGNWLTNTSTPTGTGWGAAPQLIPASWAVDTETAIIYTLNGGFSNVIASIGVDNGIFVWLNGVFLGGHLDPGGVGLNEYSFALSLIPGLNYLQVLREDHGGATGYSIEVTGDVAAVPLPAALPLLASGIAGFGWLSRRRRSRLNRDAAAAA